MDLVSMIFGVSGASGFGSASTAEEVTEGIDASNMTVIITGAASGIGAETARVLALRGAHVILAVRNMEAGDRVKKLIQKERKNARLHVLKLDLCSIKSIRDFVKNFNSMDLPLNILINNAGIMFCPFQLSEDGIESQFATNHLGHFALTNLLLDKMKNTARITGIEGRVVNLSSIAHHYTYRDGISFDKLNNASGYNDKKAYGQSKLANILHSNELARRLQAEGANVTANSVHPGVIMTPLFKHSFAISKLIQILSFFTKSIPQGAATTCYVALHPNVKGVSGKYFGDCNEKKTSSYASNESLARMLWNFSTKLANVVS